MAERKNNSPTREESRHEKKEKKNRDAQLNKNLD